MQRKKALVAVAMAVVLGTALLVPAYASAQRESSERAVRRRSSARQANAVTGSLTADAAAPAPSSSSSSAATPRAQRREARRAERQANKKAAAAAAAAKKAADAATSEPEAAASASASASANAAANASTDALITQALKRATNKAAASSDALKAAEAAAAAGDVAAALAAARLATEAAAASAEESAAALTAVQEIRQALNAKYVAVRNAKNAASAAVVAAAAAAKKGDGKTNAAAAAADKEAETTTTKATTKAPEEEQAVPDDVATMTLAPQPASAAKASEAEAEAEAEVAREADAEAAADAAADAAAEARADKAEAEVEAKGEAPAADEDSTSTSEASADDDAEKEEQQLTEEEQAAALAAATAAAAAKAAAQATANASPDPLLKPVVARPAADTYFEDALASGAAAAEALDADLSGSFDPMAERKAQDAADLAAKKAAGLVPLGADTACNKHLAQYDQCGGKSSYNSGADAAWAGECCPYGWECKRGDAYFWQCSKSSSSGGGGGGSGGGGGGGSNPIPPPSAPVAATLTSTGDVDYGVPLKLSFLFLEAQRSGKLPASQRVKWRGDTNTRAVAPWGGAIQRGYFDAGDGVIFNFPLSYAMSTVGWSVFEFLDGYQKSGQYPYALSAVRWGSDYFLSCVSPNGQEIVAQVGNGQQDHSTWGRPEDVTSPRPVYTIKMGQKGADVAGAMSAALSAAAVVFAPVDAAYSAKCLAAARQLYEFALKSPGLYHATVTDAASFYRSSNSLDDVAYAAAMLAVATPDKAAAAKYASAAAATYDRWWREEDGPKTWAAADWDSASWSAMTIMATRLFPTNEAYQRRMAHLVNSWMKGQGDVVAFTPKGLAWSTEWGSLRHTGNALFLLQVYSKYRGGTQLAQSVDCFTHRQLRYILGFDKSDRSYVVGYGRNAPQRPHHRASSCPPMPDQCTWDMFNNPGPNPQTLYGALVGGPGKDDSYKDDRGNYVNNEVAMDYQAGFIGALAAMSGNGAARYVGGQC